MAITRFPVARFQPFAATRIAAALFNAKHKGELTSLRNMRSSYRRVSWPDLVTEVPSSRGYRSLRACLSPSVHWLFNLSTGCKIALHSDLFQPCFVLARAAAFSAHGQFKGASGMSSAGPPAVAKAGDIREPGNEPQVKTIERVDTDADKLTAPPRQF